MGHVGELRHKQDDLVLCDNCGTYIYLPPDKMVVSSMPPAPQGQGSGKNAPNARLGALHQLGRHAIGIQSPWCLKRGLSGVSTRVLVTSGKPMVIRSFGDGIRHTVWPQVLPAKCGDERNPDVRATTAERMSRVSSQ